MMDLLWFLVIGLAAGWLASLFMKGKGLSLFGCLVLGVVGSLVGGFLLGVLGFTRHGHIASLITATLGSLLLLALFSAMKKR